MKYNTESNRKYTVYMHINKTNGKKYIGITCNSVKRRWQNGKGYICCKLFYRAINKYGWDGFEHLVLKENLTESEAKAMEIELIEKHKSNNRKYGYNIESGGSSWIPNDETREKISDAVKKHWSQLTDEEREERSALFSGEKNAFYNKKHTEETKKKMREKKLGRKLSEEHKKKISDNNNQKKEVVRLTLKGEYIDSFKSPTDAETELAELNVSRNCIYRVCKKVRKTYKGYKWMYLEEYEKTKSAN